MHKQSYNQSDPRKISQHWLIFIRQRRLMIISKVSPWSWKCFPYSNRASYREKQIQITPQLLLMMTPMANTLPPWKGILWIWCAWWATICMWIFASRNWKMMTVSMGCWNGRATNWIIVPRIHFKLKTLPSAFSLLIGFSLDVSDPPSISDFRCPIWNAATVSSLYRVIQTGHRSVRKCSSFSSLSRRWCGLASRCWSW